MYERDKLSKREKNKLNKKESKLAFDSIKYLIKKFLVKDAKSKKAIDMALDSTRDLYKE
jgi:hypothetical protein